MRMPLAESGDFLGKQRIRRIIEAHRGTGTALEVIDRVSTAPSYQAKASHLVLPWMVLPLSSLETGHDHCSTERA